jgi:hypothetical protein
MYAPLFGTSVLRKIKNAHKALIESGPVDASVEIDFAVQKKESSTPPGIEDFFVAGCTPSCPCESSSGTLNILSTGIRWQDLLNQAGLTKLSYWNCADYNGVGPGSATIRE